MTTFTFDVPLAYPFPNQLVSKIMSECSMLKAVVSNPPLPALVKSGRFYLERQGAEESQFLSLEFEMFGYDTQLTVYKSKHTLRSSASTGIQA